MKIIKKLVVCAFFTNVAHSADLPELPEDHPIKTAVQTTRYMFHQDSKTSGYIDAMVRYWARPAHSVHFNSLFEREEIKKIGSVVISNWKECVENLFILDNIEELLLIPSYFERSVSKEFYASSLFHFNIGETIDTLKSELDAYIHQSFDKHFTLRMEDKKFASAYKLALVYRDANTAHAENTAKANTWITEIQAKATAEVEYAAELCVALSFSPLRFKQDEKARRIIESFPQESEPRLHLQSAFDSVLTRPARPIPTGDRLIIYREIADKLFRKKDEV